MKQYIVRYIETLIVIIFGDESKKLITIIPRIQPGAMIFYQLNSFNSFIRILGNLLPFLLRI